VSAERRKRFVVALAIVASVSFALLAHAALVDRLPHALGALLSLIPLLLLLVLTVRRSGRPLAALALLALAAGGVLWLGWDSLERHFASVFFIEHAGANLLLALLFGRTLRAGEEPLVTRFARIMHPVLPPEVERYTRQVTIAWTVFFATLFTLSCLLYLGGFIAPWSFLANIASPILVASMFVVEYAVRLRVLPHWERVGILGGIRAFSRHFAAARLETPR
jgi:uncharacterized membrane protein